MEQGGAQSESYMMHCLKGPRWNSLEGLWAGDKRLMSEKRKFLPLRSAHMLCTLGAHSNTFRVVGSQHKHNKLFYRTHSSQKITHRNPPSVFIILTVYTQFTNVISAVKLMVKVQLLNVLLCYYEFALNIVWLSSLKLVARLVLWVYHPLAGCGEALCVFVS